MTVEKNPNETKTKLQQTKTPYTKRETKEIAFVFFLQMNGYISVQWETVLGVDERRKLFSWFPQFQFEKCSMVYWFL